MKLTACIAIFTFFTCPLMAAPLLISSSVQQTVLIELYTSEGCHSCPPADKWLSKLKFDKQLWKQYIPIAFHVDYWNYLGWRDPFSRAEYSQRQRLYATLGHTKTVYTPGLFKNGREWRVWFRNRSLKKTPVHEIGVLKASINNGELRASFEPVRNTAATLLLNVAVLGFDITTEVTNGENEGKNLEHDFVVLSLENYNSQVQNDNYQWHVTDTSINFQLLHAKGIAVWVSREDDPTPIQATGGWLK
ncbi:MAG: DUF1223 domain-containing protein [Gammaproteobacteria bacterium]|nr:DUF1223 domain-containing protein [Gammaproteobacteria bacterium]